MTNIQLGVSSFALLGLSAHVSAELHTILFSFSMLLGACTVLSFFTTRLVKYLTQ